MIAWVRVESDPVRLYYSDASALPLLDLGLAKHATLISIGNLSENTEGETANVSIVIGKASRAHFADPPIGVLAEIESDEGEVFAGTIKTVSVESTGITLGIEQ